MVNLLDVYTAHTSAQIGASACMRRFLFFFFNVPATTEIYTLSLHDALPICLRPAEEREEAADQQRGDREVDRRDRKSTRLNSSHQIISYAVFCLKKKNEA